MVVTQKRDTTTIHVIHIKVSLSIAPNTTVHRISHILKIHSFIVIVIVIVIV